MIILLRRKYLLPGMVTLLLTLCVAVLWKTEAAAPALSAQQDTERPLLILDAGHGGEDGGAVGADGAAESGINLAIVRKMELLLTFLGRDTLLTRPGEEAVYSPGANTLREKKRSDLQNRVAMINATQNSVMLSIHQNSLPGCPAVHGAQVFYNAVTPAERIAAAVQGSMNRTVNTGNEKTEKSMGSGVYLMKNITCPGILVECGFLSNDEESTRLQSPEYQRTLALVIVGGYLQYENS